MTIEEVAFGLYYAYRRSLDVPSRNPHRSHAALRADWNQLDPRKRVAWRAAAEYALGLSGGAR